MSSFSTIAILFQKKETRGRRGRRERKRENKNWEFDV